MATRSEDLANTFESAVADFAKVIEGCSDAQWKTICGDEGWTVAATAQHVAGQFPLEMEYIRAAAEGTTPPGYSWDDINGKNDGRAAANTSTGKADVLATLRDGAKSTAAYVRGLSDQQLDATMKLALADGVSVSTQQLLEGGVLIAHVRGHLESIQKAAQPV